MNDQSEADAAVVRLTAFAGWCEHPRGDDDEAFSDYTNDKCALDLRLLLAERRGLVAQIEALLHPKLEGWSDDEIADIRATEARRSALQGKGGGGE